MLFARESGRLVFALKRDRPLGTHHSVFTTRDFSGNRGLHLQNKQRVGPVVLLPSCQLPFLLVAMTAIGKLLEPKHLSNSKNKFLNSSSTFRAREIGQSGQISSKYIHIFMLSLRRQPFLLLSKTLCGTIRWRGFDR